MEQCYYLLQTLPRHRHSAAMCPVRMSAAPGDQHIVPTEGVSAPSKDSTTAWSILACGLSGDTIQCTLESAQQFCATMQHLHLHLQFHSCSCTCTYPDAFEHPNMQMHIHPSPGMMFRSTTRHFGPHKCGPENWKRVDVHICGISRRWPD